MVAAGYGFDIVLGDPNRSSIFSFFTHFSAPFDMSNDDDVIVLRVF